VRRHGGGPVGAAGGVLMEGATAPDVVPRAVDFGIIDGRDAVAVPAAAGAYSTSRTELRVTPSGRQAPYSAKVSTAFQSANRSMAVSDWVMVCSPTLRARAPCNLPRYLSASPLLRCRD